MKALYLCSVGIFTLYTGFTNLIIKNSRAANPSSIMFPPKGSSDVKTNSDFLVASYNIGIFEIELAKLADQKSASTDVKTFANRMITDHTTLNKDVKAVAQKMNVTLPVKLSDADLKDKLKKLEGLNGNVFDKQYTDINVKGHTECEMMFDKVSTDNSFAPAVRKLASDGLPKIKEHLQLAQNLQQKVGKPM